MLPYLAAKWSGVNPFWKKELEKYFILQFFTIPFFLIKNKQINLKHFVVTEKTMQKYILLIQYFQIYYAEKNLYICQDLFINKILYK